MKEKLFRELRMLLRPIETRIANAIARAVVERVDDSKTLQSLQLGVLDGEAVEDGERFQDYGLTSKPTAGAEALVLFPNGDRSVPLVVKVDDRRYRLTGLADGEVALYSEHGQRLHLKADGSVEVVGTEVKLGSASAVDGVIKGTTRDTAEQTFLAALSTFIATLVTPTATTDAAKTAVASAITAFQTAAGAAVSTTVKTS